MKHVMLGAPIIAMLSTVASLAAGASLLVVLSCLFLTAPAFVFLAYVICEWVYPCTPEAGEVSE